MSEEPYVRSIWSGVYDSFDQVPKASEIFEMPVWTEKQKERALNALALAQVGSFIPDSAKSKDYPFIPLLAGLISNHNLVRVLDYGGAMGQTYFEVLSKVPSAAQVFDYNILETDRVVDSVPQAIRDLPGLKFIKSLEDINGSVDVVHCGSVLQYIEEWGDFLDVLIQKANPKFFVLSDLLVGDLPSFVTAQRYYGHEKAVQYINIDEFNAFWETTPYRLSYKSNYNPLPGEDYFPAEDLPESHRIKGAIHLIFCRDA